MADDDQQQPPPEGMPKAVHQYLSQAFGRLSGQIEGARSESAQAAAVGRELVQRVAVIEWHVFGSTPPPTPPPAASKPLIARASSSEEDHDALLARELVRDARVDKIEAHILAQSKAMGVVVAKDDAGKDDVDAEVSRGRRWSAFLESRAGRSFVLKLVTLVLAAVTATMTASIAARSPLPPQQQMQKVIP